MYGRVRLASDYSEIKIRLKFAPESPAPNFEPAWKCAASLDPPGLRSAGFYLQQIVQITWIDGSFAYTRILE
jgi:hypothetical protein